MGTATYCEQKVAVPISANLWYNNNRLVGLFITIKMDIEQQGLSDDEQL